MTTDNPTLVEKAEQAVRKSIGSGHGYSVAAEAVLDAVVPTVREAERRATLLWLAGEIDPTGYGWASFKDAERYRQRLRDLAGQQREEQD